MDRERRIILDRARRMIENIDSHHREVEAFNATHPGAAVDPDPDGALAWLRRGLQDMLDRDAAKGHAGAIEAPILVAFYATRDEPNPFEVH